MPTWFARTATEFRDHNRRVCGQCDECGSGARVDPDSLIQWLGPDGDVFKSYALIVELATCPRCSGRLVHHSIVNLNLKPFHPMSYQEALVEGLEQRAWWAARDSASFKDPRAKPLPARRVRKFGKHR